MRSRAISRTKLASLAMLTGDPQEAAVIGHAALDEVRHLTSRRATADIHELARVAAARRTDSGTAALYEHIITVVPS